MSLQRILIIMEYPIHSEPERKFMHRLNDAQTTSAEQVPKALALRSTGWQVLASCGAAASAIIILVAGISKLSDLPMFAHAVATWALIPDRLEPAITTLVPVIEVALAGCWLVGLRRPLAHVGMLALTVVFTAAYVVQWTLSEPPKCGCFGKLTWHAHVLEHAPFVVARNALIILALAMSVVSVRRRS